MDKKETTSDSAWKISIGWLLLLLLGIACLYFSKSILLPFLIAFLLAYAFDPVIDFLEERKFPRPPAIWLVFSAILLSFFFILFFGIPMLQDQTTKAFDKFPVYLEHIREEVIPSLEHRFGFSLPKTFDETLETILPHLKEEAPEIFKPVTTFVLTFFTNTVAMIVAVSNLIVIPFIFYYLLRDFDPMKERLIAYIPNRYRTEVTKRLQEIDRSLSGFVRGQLLVIFLLGIFYALGLTWIGLDLALVLGIVAAVGEIVPYIGFAVGLLLSLSFAFLQFQDFIHPLYVLLLFGILQSIQGLAIAPLVMGREVGLHPLVIIAAIYIGGDLFGFVGILLAVPGAAILVVLLRALSEYYRASVLYRGSSLK